MCVVQFGVINLSFLNLERNVVFFSFFFCLGSCHLRRPFCVFCVFVFSFWNIFYKHLLGGGKRFKKEYVFKRADAEIKNDDGHDDDDKKKKFGVLFIIGAHVLPSAYNIHNWREERAYRDIVDVAAFLLAQHSQGLSLCVCV